MALQQVGVQLVAEDADRYLATMGRVDDATAAFARAAGPAVAGLDKIEDESRAAGKAVDKFGDDVKTGSKSFDLLKSAAFGAGAALGGMLVNQIANAGAAVVGFAKESIAKAGDFEGKMLEFGSVVGDSLQDAGMDLEQFSDLFIQMGRDLPVSTADVQQAAIEMAKGGIEPATIAAGGLKTALDLAGASGVSIAQSAEILSKQLGVWVDQSAAAGEKSQFLAESADLMSQAANASVVDVDELALGLANVGGQAKASGLTFRETVTTMAAISAGFSSASDAGTSFKTFLARLQPTTSTAADAMKNLNLLTEQGKSIFYDASGSFIGMEQTAEILQDRLSGLSDAEKIAALNAIFGADAFRTASILADKGAEGYRAMAEAMAKVGSVASQAGARQQGFNVALDNLMGSLEALQIIVGTALLPALTNLMYILADGVNAITDYAEATIEGETALAKIAGTIADLFVPALYGATAATIAWAVANSGQLGIALALLIQRIPLVTAATIANAQATLLAAAPYAAIALAIGGVVLAWNKFNEAAATATQELLNSRQWWIESGDAVARYGTMTGEAQAKLAPYAATIRELRTEIEGEVESLGKRVAAGLISEAQYQTEMAAINAKREGLIQVTAAYTAEEEALARETAAGMTATNQAALLTSANALLGGQVSLTAKDVEELGKKIQETYQKGQDALNQFAANYSAFATGVETRGAQFAEQMAALEAQKAAATTAEQKTGIDEQIAQLKAGYAEQEASAAQSYAAQQAAQRQHLGQMLIDYTVSQATLGNIAKDKAAEITAALEAEYGLQESSTATTFLNMAQSVDQYATSSGGSINQLIGDLRDNEQTAKDTQKAMDDYAHEYVATQVNNFLEGKGDADSYIRALESIPKTINTRVITTYESRGDNTSASRDMNVSGYRAAGGPVEAGQLYMTGEQGPELFVPDRDGTILSASDTRRAAASPAQIAQSTMGSTTIIDNSRNLTMPTYTNLTQSAIQDSAAIALALMP